MNEQNEGEPNHMERRAGQFVWDQAYILMKEYNITNLYFGMFDEFDEGTAFMKAARDYFDIPNDQYILTLAADGWWLSSDFYLRTAGAITEMMKDKKQLRTVNDVPHALGPLYWRNSFEMRDARAKLYDGKGDTKIESRPNQPVDPCLNSPALLTQKGKGITLTANRIVSTPGHSGAYVFMLAGEGKGSAYYKLADVKITAATDMELRYVLKPLDEPGRKVFVDVLFEDGSLLSEHANETIAERGTVNAWSEVTVAFPASLAGKKMVGVVAGYAGDKSFSSYVDDIIIQKHGN